MTPLPEERGGRDPFEFSDPQPPDYQWYGPASYPDAEPETQPMPALPPAGLEPSLPALLPAEPEPPPSLLPALPDPADGGRAARRRAAQDATRRAAKHGGSKHAPAKGSSSGKHGRAAITAGTGRAHARGSGPAGAASSGPVKPMSRVEARRAARAAKGGIGVMASRAIGELFITSGVLMLLFVTYQLWWTNVIAGKQANAAVNSLQDDWDTGSGSEKDSRDPGDFAPGQGFAIIYIPKLDVRSPIAQGVGKEKVLDKGEVGHYTGKLNAGMPWDKTANFALAGHRNGHGEPFRYINKLVYGDKIVVETATKFYTYSVTSRLAQTPSSNVDVISAVPRQSGFTAPGRYITLTTCTPEFTSKYRLIIWGKMVDEQPRSEGKPDALVQ